MNGGEIVSGYAPLPRLRVRTGRGGRPYLKVLIATDSFKESMTAPEAAEAVRRGVARAARRVGATVFTDACPVSDGGEGFVDALLEATGGESRTTRVTGPLGVPVKARWGVLGGQAPERAHVRTGDAVRAAVERALDVPAGSLARDPKPLAPWKTAVIEASSACGLHLVPKARRDPERTTTFGVGELIAAALDEGCGRIVIGLGGSSTVDGAVGAARALGVRFTGEDGRPLTSAERPHPAGADLADLAHVAVNARDGRLTHCALVVATDVDNPLLGPDGAATVFGPQKGATPEQVERLEAGLANLVERLRQVGIEADPGAPGAGAAGGLGYGLCAMLDAKRRPGAELVLEAVRFAQRASDADIVITGEGRLDRTSASGKIVAAVARLAREAGAMPIALVGSLGEGADEAAQAMGLQAYAPIAPEGEDPSEAMARAPELLEKAAERTMRAAFTGDTRG